MEKAYLLEGNLPPNHGVAREKVKERVLVEEDLNLGANKAMVTVAVRLVTIVEMKATSKGIARNGSGMKKRTKVARVM